MPAPAAAPDRLTADELFPVPLEPLEPQAHQTRRLESIDLLRGLLMILMALDHVRDFFSSAQVNPTDPLESWPALYATRWITHLCAPGFIALAGASVYLQQARGKSLGQLQRLLITRGLWLILLELTVIDFAWAFAFQPFLQVIWAIGAAMIGLGLVLRLRPLGVGILGAVIVCAHELLDPIHAAALGGFGDLWKLAHEPGQLTWQGHPIGIVLYAALPWFGVICLGYAFGTAMRWTVERRRRLSLTLAAIFAAVFGILRALHAYGDRNTFTQLPTHAQSVMSFLNVQKYPPSLHYVLATFTILLLLLTLFDLLAERAWLTPVRTVLRTFGRVPFAYYVPHIYLIHLAALVTTAALGGDWHRWIGTGGASGEPPASWGYTLPVVYAIWIAVVAALFPWCLWFSRLKAERRDWWLSYL